MKKFCLGSVLVTNVGMFDVPDCYAPNNSKTVVK